MHAVHTQALCMFLAPHAHHSSNYSLESCTQLHHIARLSTEPPGPNILNFVRSGPGPLSTAGEALSPSKVALKV